MVINGNRRLAAARLAELPTLAVHLTGLTGSDLASVRAAVLVENIHRKDLEPLEEARAVAELVELHGTQAVAAEQVGKSQGWVSQRLSLLSLEPELRDDLASGALRVREARSLARLSAREQLQAREDGYYPVISEGATEGSSGVQAGGSAKGSGVSGEGAAKGAPARERAVRNRGPAKRSS
ncbi:ParB/RepB/Spo0J family partition protein (plasmid) [Nocardiopsis eucommiae]|uniref:ParB/RepB/Spo0J family partition protein n=1 Tax=Nocardiopsis eucommiae TaxID=2831970 RepID=A0A975LDY4_9ACTN|nr:ParB/RepB/Spo0J family partition protein [Nocardiopsis eucommiae]